MAHNIMALDGRLFKYVLRGTVSLGIGFAIVGLSELHFSQAFDKPLSVSDPDVFITNGVLASLPFLALSARFEQHVVPWLVGIVASAWLAWWWVQKGIAYQRAPDGSGVDMGGALIVLLSPFVIGAICLTLSWWLDNRPVSDS